MWRCAQCGRSPCGMGAASQSSDDVLLDLAQRPPCRRHLTGKGNGDRAGRPDFDRRKGVRAGLLGRPSQCAFRGWPCRTVPPEPLPRSSLRARRRRQPGCRQGPRHRDWPRNCLRPARRRSRRARSSVISTTRMPLSDGPCGSFFDRTARRPDRSRTGGIAMGTAASIQLVSRRELRSCQSPDGAGRALNILNKTHNPTQNAPA